MARRSHTARRRVIPVGGGPTLDAAAAAETVSLLEPRVVLPMHFKTEAVKFNLDPVEKFLKELGLQKVVPEPRLSLTKTTLPPTTQVHLLDYRR